MPFVYANGLDIYYERHGTGEPLILIPGLGSIARSWINQVEYFKQFYQVITFDNRGCGKSSVPEGSYTIGDLADDIAGLMDCLEIGQANFVGRSMGGKALQEFAIKYPYRVKKMVLSNTTACPNPQTKMVFKTWLDLAEQQVSPELLMQNIVSWVYTKEQLASLTREVLEVPLEAPMVTFAVQSKACLQHNTVQRLSNVDKPTLVIAGEKDILTPVEDARLLAEGIAGSRLVVIKDTAHCPYMEKPGQFNQEISNFLNA